MKDSISSYIDKLSRINIELWHEEDKARLTDDAEVVKAKRRIDALNQQRNDCIEEIDVEFLKSIGKKNG
ncbi:MAG: DUF4254 domain-containing protein [bacterium]